MDGQIGTTRLIAYFRNYANAPKDSHLDAEADLLAAVKAEIKP
jgi:hypothetical protein